MFLLPWSRARLLADAKKLGRWGEKYCLKYLKGKGFRAVALNYRCKAGEIDLVVGDAGGRLIFVEVKTRASEEWAKAQDAVDRRKQERMFRVSREFCRKYKIKDRPLRFDVVAIVLGEKGQPEIRHYENAFRPR